MSGHAPRGRETALSPESSVPSPESSVLSPQSSPTGQIWQALHEIEDPEIPVSLVDMGLIVSVDYEASTRTAKLRITYTAMGCPAMEMIQDDIRTRLLGVDGVEAVEIEVVWDPVWTRKRLSESARATMRELGIAV